ncbi:hypothetical protein ACWEK7_36130, partial [Streptomyces californicus]
RVPASGRAAASTTVTAEPAARAAVANSAPHRALPAARSAWIRRAGALLASADRADPRCGTPGRVPHPGLLTGLSGIGHGLLRAGFPERIGSALLLRPSRAP